MSVGWNIIQGLVVTILTFMFSQWEIQGKWAPIGTALKGLLAVVVSFLVAVAQGLFTGAFAWHEIWSQLPIIVGWAMGIYGIIIKPADKFITASKTTTPPDPEPYTRLKSN